jgi:hypothetical protein
MRQTGFCLLGSMAPIAQTSEDVFRVTSANGKLAYLTLDSQRDIANVHMLRSY